MKVIAPVVLSGVIGAAISQLTVAAWAARHAGATDQRDSARRERAGLRGAMSPAQLQQAEAERDATLYARYRDESEDPEWAPDMNVTVAGTIGQSAAGRTFSVDLVDCRTTMCLANVHWPNYGAALSEFRQVGRGMPCASEINVPAPADRAGRYGARLMLDCEQLRAAKK